jgi:HTH-type transcriptional regulator, sugar sensing transcriptional regulator
MVYLLFIDWVHMDASLLITLQEYGFSDKEAKVYLTALEIGSSPASTIARRSEIKRVTVYTILEDLKKKWIASETTKENVKYYSVISPDSLLRQVEQKYESLKEKIPELMALADKFGNRPKTQFFEGLEWVKRMYDDLLTSINEPIYAFMGRENTSPKLRAYFDHEFIPQRVKNKIWAKVILSESQESLEYKKMHHNKKKLTDTIMIKYDNLQEWIEINIYGDFKVMIAMRSEEDISWIIISSKKLHDALLNIFNFIWATKNVAKC